jgi:hypothetical protein
MSRMAKTSPPGFEENVVLIDVLSTHELGKALWAGTHRPFVFNNITYQSLTGFFFHLKTNQVAFIHMHGRLTVREAANAGIVSVTPALEQNYIDGIIASIETDLSLLDKVIANDKPFFIDVFREDGRRMHLDAVNWYTVILEKAVIALKEKYA